tara:strand:+ start:369 stop:770 length:402 start_codon:yes stop_codon:yes gene_type:complete
MISKKIIQIASNTKYSGLKNYFTHKSTIKNSLCGDKIKIELIANKKVIRSMRYEVESCILCEASASLIANKIKNYSFINFKKDVKTLKDNIKNKKTIIPSKFKEFRHLITKDNLNRVNCVILPLQALLKAFKL